MKEQIEKIRQEALTAIANAEDAKQLDEAKVKYLGKKGELTAVLRGMGALSAEERPVIGGFVNVVKTELEEQIKQKEEMYEKAELHKEHGAWQMIFGVNTVPSCRKRGCAGELIKRALADAKAQGWC